MGNGSQNGPGESRGEVIFATFSRPCPKVDFWIHFGRPVAPFGLPFGSLWLLLGSLWLTFGPLWLTLGSLWLTFASLLPPFGSLLLSPGLIFHIFNYFRRKCRAKLFFYVFFIKNYIFGQPNRTFPKCAERTPTEKTSSFVTYLQGSGAEHLPLAT